jgi:hypothetical protein
MPDFSFLNDDDDGRIRINTAGRITRKRGSPTKPAKRNPAAGCLLLLLLIGGCVYWTAVSTPPPQVAQQMARARPQPAARPRAVRPDDYAAPPLGRAPEEFFGQLYRDLKTFRNDPLFFQVGFGQGQRFYPWLEAVQRHAIGRSMESQAAWGEKWFEEWCLRQNENHPHAITLPGELQVLGLQAYSEQVWPFNEMSENWESQFGRGR